MKPVLFVSSILAVGLALNVPTLVFAHVGHGDEFQAQGGVQRVKVNAETDQMLGIVVAPIAPAADGSAVVMIPVSALVDANGKQLVFVQYEKFYEPVPITTGATKGELITVTQGLSAGEKLVTQGSLSLYAESRKTQTADASPSPAAPTTAASANPAHAHADAQGIPHSHTATGEMAGQTGGLPLGPIAIVGAGVVLLGGGIALFNGKRKKVSPFSNKNDGGL
jgi:membrane fusion protein, cation efflux system